MFRILSSGPYYGVQSIILLSIVYFTALLLFTLHELLKLTLLRGYAPEMGHVIFKIQYRNKTKTRKNVNDLRCKDRNDLREEGRTVQYIKALL